MNDSYTFSNYKDIFPQSLHHFQHTFANNEQDVAHQYCKIPHLDFEAHHENFVSIHCDLQNGIHVVHPLQGCQIRTVSRLGKKSTSHFCECLECAQAGARPGIVVRGKKDFHVLVRTNSTDALLQFV
jgi:hypothetical protein